jgi:chemotaxis family two-component system response regulator Rcp1
MDTLRTLRLLVVEDDPVYQYLVEWAFASHAKQTRWALTFAVDGTEALCFLFEEGSKMAPLPDLILLDRNLPKVSGSEVLQRLKQDQKLRKIPILVFSSSAADCDIIAAYDEHANGYITKPRGLEAWETIPETIERFCQTVQLPRVVR